MLIVRSCFPVQFEGLWLVSVLLDTGFQASGRGNGQVAPLDCCAVCLGLRKPDKHCKLQNESNTYFYSPFLLL